MDVSILVNNVGMNNIEDFEKLNEQKMRDELIVNTLPITMLCYRFIPQMLRR
jgi:17beta-estradiol 17-dehydrogenase / very-long-chain 3-oxoacyl-CoA reductase